MAPHLRDIYSSVREELFMPAWVAAALRVIALAFGGGAAFELGQRALPPGRGPEDFDFQNGTTGPFDFLPFVGPEGRRIEKKRRRRRRALTASDRADIAFIVGLLGPTAGKNFAVTLAGRSR